MTDNASPLAACERPGGSFMIALAPHAGGGGLDDIGRDGS
jgi:hypothetical protein